MSEQADNVIYFGIKMANCNIDDNCESEMIQIGAVDEHGSSFMSYIVPVGDIDQASTRVHGISKKRGRLSKFGRKIPVKSVATAREGLKKFLKFIKAKAGSKKAILINCCRAMALKTRITRSLKATDVEKFGETVHGLADTFPVFGNHLDDVHEFVKSSDAVPPGKANDAFCEARLLQRVIKRAAREQRMSASQFISGRLNRENFH